MSKNKRERENEREKRGREGVGRDNFTDSSDIRANVLGHIYFDQQNCAQLYYRVRHKFFDNFDKCGQKAEIMTHKY